MKARENPFRVDRLHALQFRFLESDLASLLLRLEGARFTGAIVGPHGTGKSTLLNELVELFRSQGKNIHRLMLTEASRTTYRQAVAAWLASARPGEILILDGAEQLDRAMWKRVQRASQKAAGLLITAHQPGLLPTLYECRSNDQLLVDLVHDLLGASHSLAANELSQMLKQHGGNVRECLRELYDRYAEGP